MKYVPRIEDDVLGRLGHPGQGAERKPRKRKTGTLNGESQGTSETNNCSA